jgi:hypothetical protein
VFAQWIRSLAAIEFVACFLCGLGLAGYRPAATHLSFASPKESKQRKGDPAVCDPSLRYGPLRCSVQPGSAQTRLRLKQRAALIRLAFRASAQTEGVGMEYKYQQPSSQKQTTLAPMFKTLRIS